MSVIGLINLMEMAKQGATFGELSPRRQTIEHIDAAALSAVQEDITAFYLSVRQIMQSETPGRSLVTPSITTRGNTCGCMKTSPRTARCITFRSPKRSWGPLNQRVCSPR